MIDPEELADLPLGQRERIAFQLVSEACSRAAEILGDEHASAMRLRRAAASFGPPPRLRFRIFATLTLDLSRLRDDIDVAMSRRTWNGQRARDARKTVGLSPEAVAEQVGAHRASVYGWEAGREPQMRHALALADLYEVSVESFFAHAEDADMPPGAGEESPNNHEPGAASDSSGARLAHTGG